MSPIANSTVVSNLVIRPDLAREALRMEMENYSENYHWGKDDIEPKFVAMQDWLTLYEKHEDTATRTD